MRFETLSYVIVLEIDQKFGKLDLLFNSFINNIGYLKETGKDNIITDK